MSLGLVFTGLSLLMSGAGAGISAAASSRAEDRRVKKSAELTEKGLEQDKFQFGFQQLADQRRGAEQKAMRSVFSEQLLNVLNKGAPGVSTF